MQLSFLINKLIQKKIIKLWIILLWIDVYNNIHINKLETFENIYNEIFKMWNKVIQNEYKMILQKQYRF